ncbi:MAG: hypothetical protein V1738_03305 [Patescibacteria group bacterium]
MTNQNTAIVPVREAPLTKPRRFWQGKPAPTKVRHYVEFEPPVGEYRPGHAPELRYVAVQAEDLSLYRLAGEDVDRKFAVAMGQIFGQTTLGIVIGGVAGGPVGAVLGMYFGFTSGLAVALSYVAISGRRGINKKLSGRLDESAELQTAIESLLLLTDGTDMFGAGTVRLPVEALFRGLGHDDDDVRQFSSELIAQLPEDIRNEGITKFFEHLTSEQLSLLPDAELPPVLARAHDLNCTDWPEQLVTMTKVEED